MNFPPNFADSGCNYWQRGPEFLTVSGYRNSLAAQSNRNQIFSADLEETYLAAMGSLLGSHAARAMAVLVESLGVCAHCPLRSLPPEAETLCRDECLLLGLIASIQHGDEAAMQMTICALTCPTRSQAILAPAGDYAISLKCSGQILLPMPPTLLTEIAQAAATGPQISTRLH